MKQKLFKECGILQLTDGNKSYLYKVPENAATEPFEINPLPFLSESSALEVYPDANLIVTQSALITLDGKTILSNRRDKISVVPVNNEWMIIQDSLQDNDSRFQIMFWDGTKERDYIWGRYLVRGKKYLAVYTSGDRRWIVYDYKGDMFLDVGGEMADMEICGDFFITKSIGNCSAYTLCKQKTTLAQDHCVFKQKLLILCSEHENFAISANLQGMVQTYFNGEFSDYGKAEMIDLYDRADLFVLKRGGKFYLYRFNGDSFAENICPCGADLTAFDEQNNSLLIGANGSFRLINL